MSNALAIRHPPRKSHELFGQELPLAASLPFCNYRAADWILLALAESDRAGVWSPHTEIAMPLFPDLDPDEQSATTERCVATGRFTAGNGGGPGNPLGGQVARLRAAILAAVTPDDLQQLIRVLVDKAKAGDIAATKEILNRTVGKPSEPDLLERIARLEQMLQEVEHGA